MSDGWSPHADGFVSGHVGVFPGHFGSWEVWDNLSGEWRCSEPFTFVGKMDSREETIAEAKRLAQDKAIGIGVDLSGGRA